MNAPLSPLESQSAAVERLRQVLREMGENARAEESLEVLHARLADLQKQVDAEIAALTQSLDPASIAIVRSSSPSIPRAASSRARSTVQAMPAPPSTARIFTKSLERASTRSIPPPAR